MREGVVNTYAMNFVVPVPANIADLEFSWQSLAGHPVRTYVTPPQGIITRSHREERNGRIFALSSTVLPFLFPDQIIILARFQTCNIYNRASIKTPTDEHLPLRYIYIYTHTCARYLFPSSLLFHFVLLKEREREKTRWARRAWLAISEVQQRGTK